MKYLYIALITVMITGCAKKEDPSPSDQRDQMVGNYSGTVDVYDVSYLKIKTYAVSIKAQKKIGDDDRVDFFDLDDNGSLLFFGNKLKPVSNGIAFDIPYQPISTLYAQGSKGINVGSTKYDGAYFSDGKTISIYLKLFDGSGGDYGYMEFNLVKN